MKKTLAALCALTLVPLAGCSAADDDRPPSDNDAIPMCVNARTHERLPESQCGGEYMGHETGSSDFIWWFMLGNMLAPSYGQPVTVGYATPPANVRVVNHYYAPSTGGTVKKATTNPTFAKVAEQTRKNDASKGVTYKPYPGQTQTYKPYQPNNPANAGKYEAPKGGTAPKANAPAPAAPKAPAPAPAKPAAPAAPAGGGKR